MSDSLRSLPQMIRDVFLDVREPDADERAVLAWAAHFERQEVLCRELAILLAVNPADYGDRSWLTKRASLLALAGLPSDSPSNVKRATEPAPAAAPFPPTRDADEYFGKPLAVIGINPDAPK